MTLFLSLDIGTSTLCALALSKESMEPIAIYTAPNDADVPALVSGRHEQNPERIRECCLNLLRQVISDPSVVPGDIKGMAITGQMHGIMLIDANLRPLSSLITWRDQRTLTDGTLESARRAMPAEAFLRTGCHLSAGYGGATLHWMATRQELPKGAVALTIADYLAGVLTGRAASEPTHAASWGILDVERGEWDMESVHCLGIPPEILPALNPSAQMLGEMLPAVAREIGLPHPIPVASPVGDNQASIIGVAGFDEKALVVNLGTGGQVSVPKSEYSYVPGLETRPMPLGGYILVGASLCGGWSYAYLRKFFQSVLREIGGIELSDGQVYQRMNELASQVARGCDGLTVDTRFSGSRIDPLVTGSIQGITVSNLTPANLSRAMSEGMVQELASMAKSARMEGASYVVAAGNAVRLNPVIAQEIERAFGIPCRVTRAREEAAMGAGKAVINYELRIRN